VPIVCTTAFNTFSKVMAPGKLQDLNLEATGEKFDGGAVKRIDNLTAGS
jgi:hypothetical protein